MAKKKEHLIGILSVIVSIAIAVLFLSQPLAQAQQGAAPMTTQATTGQVTPVLNTNVTWSLFNSSMAPNEYLNGSGDPQYLNAEPSVYNPNYISINPTDLISPTLQNSSAIANTYWQNSTVWKAFGAATSQVVSHNNLTVNGQKGIDFRTNYTDTSAENPIDNYLKIPITDLPSSNLQYDYLTITGTTSGVISGASSSIYIGNTSISGYDTGLTVNTTTGMIQTHDQTGFNDVANGNGAFFYTIALGKTGLTFGSTNDILIDIAFGTPKTTTIGEIYTNITGLSLTQSALTLGSSSYSNHIITRNGFQSGLANLSNFNPTFNWNKIANGSYTESLSEPLGMAQNLTETQAEITSGPYIEEVTQQAIMSFPTAPDLTYGPSNMTLEMNGINGTQVTLINVNGASYSSGLSGFNGTSFNIGTENPNSPNSVIIQIEYTAAQWNSFTSAPSFFSVAGIEYYWWIFIISTLGAVGLFAGLKSYATGKEETQRIVPPPRTR